MKAQRKLSVTLLVFGAAGLACAIAALSPYGSRDTWLTIQNDDPIWSVEGPFNVPEEYDDSDPSGTVTELSAGSRMSVSVTGTRIAVYGPGGPGFCGTGAISIDGKEAAGKVPWPFLPADQQAVWVSGPLAAGEHQLTITATSPIAVDYLRIWPDSAPVPAGELPRVPSFGSPPKAPSKPRHPQAGQPLNAAPGRRQHRLEFPIDGLPSVRRHVVHLPPAPVAGMPVVFVLHGIDGTAEGMIEYTGFSSKADEERFLVVYLESPQAWTSGREHRYVMAVVDDVVRDYAADPNRVYAVGFSAGGYMCQSLAMFSPDTFAAAASVSAGVPPRYVPYPESNRYAIPVLELHNRSDTVVRFAGTADAIRFWCRFNGIDEAPEVSHYDAMLTQERYARTDGVEVLLLHFQNGSDGFGHHWPRPHTYGFEAADPIWEFFSRHRLGESNSPEE